MCRPTAVSAAVGVVGKQACCDTSLTVLDAGCDNETGCQLFRSGLLAALPKMSFLACNIREVANAKPHRTLSSQPTVLIMPAGLPLGSMHRRTGNFDFHQVPTVKLAQHISGPDC
jgi:hypothetical protein